MNNTWILFIRHGETDWNKDHRMQGQTEIPLNTAGREQAKKIGKQLQKFPIDIFYVSPQIRARKTAQAISRYHKTSPVITHEALKERSFGTLEGIVFEEIEKIYPMMNFELSWDYPEFLPPGGERIRDVFERTDRFLQEVIPKHEGKTIAVVAHGVTLRCMICNLLGWPLSHNPFFQIANTSLTIIKKTDAGNELHVINNISHLM